MPELKTSLPQALWGLIILAGAYLPLEEFIDRFCHWFTNFDGLKKRQLSLNLCHRQLAHKNSSLQASQGHQ